MFGLFNRREIAENDVRRLDRVIENVESLTRRYESLVADLDEFYSKVNRARQRVDKQERDAKKSEGGLDLQPPRLLSRAEQKEQLRQRLRG